MLGVNFGLHLYEDVSVINANDNGSARLFSLFFSFFHMSMEDVGFLTRRLMLHAPF